MHQKGFNIYDLVNSEPDFELDTNRDVTFTDLTEALSTETDGHFTLPPHYRCTSHTINLISTGDVEKYLTSGAETKAVYIQYI